MKLKFKNQQYQIDATNAIVDCFSGQTKINVDKVAMYSSRDNSTSQQAFEQLTNIDIVSNPKLHINDNVLISNIQKVQEANNIPSSDFKNLKDFSIEMETGTGKTYTYINTMYELYNKYGFSKFIIVVPSIAIREGVNKTFEATSDHFQEKYGKKIRHYIYNSSKPQDIIDFSGNDKIQCIIMNYQAFNAKSADARKIYQERDEFGSNKPIDLLRACNPIMIIDEPQKISDSTEEKINEEFNPLFILRYSATHKKGKEYNKVYSLNAVDAYNQKLVKKIEVIGLELINDKSEGTYIYVSQIEPTKKGPVAHLEIDKYTPNGIKKISRKFNVGDDLYTYSDNLEAYKGYVVSEIDAMYNFIEFTNGKKLIINELVGETDQNHIFRAQIKETIKKHLEKESLLYKEGIKVLSLFFIDKVVNYRDFDDEEQKGLLAKIFEEVYSELIGQLPLDEEYKKYLLRFSSEEVHNGYFSVDKKGKVIDSKEKKSGKELIGSDDVDAYDLILKDKERLLSFEEPTRFIFSHSALREGWDNPNVFQICTLRETKSEISKRQEIGRGLRICVNQKGERIDFNKVQEDFHAYNTLTVIANESYESFSSLLQKEIAMELTERRIKFDASKFINQTLINKEGHIFTINVEMSKEIQDHFFNYGYIDYGTGEVTQRMKDDFSSEKLNIPEKLEPFKDSLYIFLDNNLFEKKYSIENASNKNIKFDKFKLNENFEKKEFQELWNKINIKSKFEVNFDTNILISKSIQKINEVVQVKRMEVKKTYGSQKEEITDLQLRENTAMYSTKNSREKVNEFSYSEVSYDLVGEVKDKTNLMRKTIIKILKGIDEVRFNEFKYNPEEFIIQVSKIINEKKASCVIENIKYYRTENKYDTEIFIDNKISGQLGVDVQETKKHVYDYVKTDSNVEFNFAKELEIEDEVIVYAKLPNGFKIPTPIGNYNPDWALVINKNNMKHVYFIAETKGTTMIEELRIKEQAKVSCARKHFKAISDENIKYEVVNDYKTLHGLLT